MCGRHTTGFNSHCSLDLGSFIRLVVSPPRHVHSNIESHSGKILILDSSGWTAQWGIVREGQSGSIRAHGEGCPGSPSHNL